VGVALDGSFECMFGWTDLSAIDDKREVNTTVKGDRLEQRKWVKVGEKGSASGSHDKEYVCLVCACVCVR